MLLWYGPVMKRLRTGVQTFIARHNSALSSPLQSKQDGARTARFVTSWFLYEAGQAIVDAVRLGLVAFARTMKRYTMLGNYSHCRLEEVTL